jgi:hypothetical protein
MERVPCPYCEVEVRMDAVDNDGGACPECGAMITGSLLFSGSGDEVEEDEFDLEVTSSRKSRRG